MGTTTNVFLRVIAQETTKEGDSLGLISEDDEADDQSDLEQIPAFSLPEEKQIDIAYPNFCQALLGKKEPVRFFTMGLCSKILRPDDTIFASIRGASSGNDVFFCPLPFDNMDEFMVLSEEGWKQSSEHAKRYRVGWVSYHIFPPNEHGKVAHQTCLDQEAEDSMAAFGPKNVFLYKDKICIESDFRFSESFPRTAEQLASGRFRWFRYQKGVLEVIVGRNVRDPDHTRNAEPEQILRTWRRRFTSVHELLCAVEASWIIPGGSFEPLGKRMLPLYDSDLGPSDPLPPGPADLGGADETTLISAPERLPQVTALAIAKEGTDSAFVISGHKDGSLRKWNLNQSKCVWAIRHYAVSAKLQKLEGYPSTGIRGIAIRKDPKRGYGTYSRLWLTDLFAVPLTFAVSIIYSAIFTWPWPEVVEDDGSTEIRVLSVRDGSLLDRIEVESFNNVSCLVFARVSYPSRWKDCLLVGIDEPTEAPEYRDDFRDYDVVRANRNYRGNILPIGLSNMGGDAFKTWRGHSGAIRSMAVVPDKYLVSVSMHPNTELPDKLIVWDLQDSGLPLRSITFVDDDYRSAPPVFSALVGGIAICGSNVLLCGNYGDGLIPIHLNESKGRLSVDMKGVVRLGQRTYEGADFHGHMVGSGKDAILINEAMTDAWIYDIASLGDQPNLKQDFSECEDGVEEDEEEEMRHLRDRSRATGKISFPRRGGAKEKKKAKKRKHDSGGFDSFEGFNFDNLDTVSESGGAGGPEVLAINGRYVLAGFRNGAILQGKLLPPSPGRRVSHEYGTLASYSAAIPQC
jgi:hypothetical protein